MTSRCYIHLRWRFIEYFNIMIRTLNLLFSINCLPRCRPLFVFTHVWVNFFLHSSHSSSGWFPRSKIGWKKGRRRRNGGRPQVSQAPFFGPRILCQSWRLQPSQRSCWGISASAPCSHFSFFFFFPLSPPHLSPLASLLSQTFLLKTLWGTLVNWANQTIL